MKLSIVYIKFYSYSFSYIFSIWETVNFLTCTYTFKFINAWYFQEGYWHTSSASLERLSFICAFIVGFIHSVVSTAVFYFCWFVCFLKQSLSV